MRGEHARGSGARSLPGRLLAATRGRNTRHRPRLGAMSTSLLDTLLTDHLDHGYAEAAERRAKPAADGAVTAGPSRTTPVLLAIGLLLVGYVLATAYRSTAQQAPDSERARQGLVRDVEQGTATSDTLQRRAESLGGQLVRERDAALTASETGDRVSRQVGDLERAAALVPVHGPGISVLLGDAAPSQQIDPATGKPLSVPPDDSGRLRDRDLQSVVNALWAAGAEAIAINDERLAPTTTIRAAGEAILVDLRPVTSPYTVKAIGDPDTLLPRFADSVAARRYQSLSSVFGISFTVHRETDLALRPATGTDLRYAEPLDSAPASTGGAAPRSAGGGPRSPAPASPTQGTGSPGSGGGR
jgi:uncharacterized protein YlxW (UPF0749 family)